MRTLKNLRAPAIAIVTIIAVLFFPACGSLCAAMNHCSTSAVSSNADSCHHTDAAMRSDVSTLSVSSAATCGEQAPLVAVLTNSESSVQLSSSNLVATPFSFASRTQAVVSPIHPINALVSNESPQQSIPLANLSILRI